MRHYGDFLKAFLSSYPNGHKQFLTWSCISAIAAAVGRKCFFVDRDLHTYPNLYIMLVGASGAGKTVSSMRAVELLKGTDRVFMMPQELSSNGLFTYLLKASKEGYNLVSIEGQQKVTASAMLYAPEAEGFIGHNKQREYTVSALTSLFDTHGPTSEFTKTGNIAGVVKLHNHCVNLLTCTTPVMMNYHLTPLDLANGFAARLLIVNDYSFYGQAEIGHANVQDSILSADVKKALTDDLRAISMLQGRFTIGIGATATINDAVKKNNAFMELNWNNPYMGYYSRKKMFIMKLAMLMSVSEGPSMEIAPHHVDKAIKLLEGLEERSQEALRRVGEPGLTELMQGIWTYIRFHDFSKTRLQRQSIFNKFVDNQEIRLKEVKTVLNDLEAVGRIRQIKTASSRYIIEKISDMPLYPTNFDKRR